MAAYHSTCEYGTGLDPPVGGVRDGGIPVSRPRVVVADDSHFMRSVITDILEGGGVDVVGEARNGREAVGLVAETRPDVVTMDLQMPGMDGIEATERITAETPTPILMLSAHTTRRADVTFEALESGAVDFLAKPGGEVSVDLARLEERLVETVTAIAAGGDAYAAGADPSARPVPVGAGAELADPTLVVGSSTGGPAMVERVLSELPVDADFRVLVVQHMPAGFTARFAERLDAHSDYDIREATDGERVGGGEALVAPGDRHMAVAGSRDGRLSVELRDDPPVNGVRPAVDVTMESAAAVLGDDLVGVVLTGMGADGAAGVAAVAAGGGRTIAQDEATSAVFAMPRRAIETGAVDEVLAIEDIPRGILATAREVP